jgi:AraC-like DNA-binding protein
MLTSGFTLARLSDLDELESGVYWPRLQPYFAAPHFRRLTYQLMDRPHRGSREVLSTRGASGLRELDIAYVADRHATTMHITDAGILDYCLTLVSRGALACRGSDARGSLEANASAGLIYRGLPGLRLSASEDHERLAIWIPAASLRQRLAGLLGFTPSSDILFDPVVDMSTPGGETIKHLVRLLTEELASGHPFAGSDIACRSFTDLLLYAMLESLPHNHSRRVASVAGASIPGTVRRAEEYIRSHAGQPIALHEIAEAAGCSVRSLQYGFRWFRDVTPMAAITRARLEAAREALKGDEVAGTVTDVALRYGFTNPGRFSKLYRAAFGVSPAEELRRLPARLKKSG